MFACEDAVHYYAIGDEKDSVELALVAIEEIHAARSSSPEPAATTEEGSQESHAPVDPWTDSDPWTAGRVIGYAVPDLT